MHQDLRDLFRRELESAGFKVQADYPVDPKTMPKSSMKREYYDAWNLAYQYYNTIHKLRPGIPRTVFWSKELIGKHNDKTLSAHQLAAINEIIAASSLGQSLLRFMSGSIQCAIFNDKLFSAWRIAHFHLDVRPSSEPRHRTKLVHFANRTGPVLFAFLDKTGLYLLDIRKHGKEHPTAFTDRELVEILHRNWPQIIREYALQNATGGWCASSKTIKELRDKNCNMSFATEDGAIYLPFGGGLTSGGTNAEVTILSDKLFYLCDRALAVVEDEYEKIINKIESERGIRLGELWLTLTLDQRNRPVFMEKTLGVILNAADAPLVAPLRYPRSA